VNNTISWNTADDVVAVIETKSKGEPNLERYEDQLIKYVKSFKCNVGFITNYEDLIGYVFSSSLEVLTTQVYRSDVLEELADFIANFIEKETKISIQKSPDEIIALLEKSINSLMKYTERISGEEWESVLRISDEPEKEAKKKEYTDVEKRERETFFQRSAAYIAIAQILFYITFRQFRIDDNINFNPKLVPLSVANGIPTQIQEILEEVPNNNLNFKAIFGKDKEVLSKLDDDASHVH